MKLKMPSPPTPHTHVSRWGDLSYSYSQQRMCILWAPPASRSPELPQAIFQGQWASEFLQNADKYIAKQTTGPSSWISNYSLSFTVCKALTPLYNQRSCQDTNVRRRVTCRQNFWHLFFSYLFTQPFNKHVLRECLLLSGTSLSSKDTHKNTVPALKKLTSNKQKKTEMSLQT